MNRITKGTFAAFAMLLLAAVAYGLTGALAGHMVTMTGQDAFAPKNVKVRAGETVTWQNRDEDNHTVESDTGVAGLDSDAAYPNGVAPGNKFRWTVPGNATSGTVYFYHCRFHGTAGNGSSYGTGMVGSITVK
jgi:plastocyanin